MKKNSILIYSVCVLLSVVVIGGVYYMAVERHATEPADPASETWQTLNPDQPKHTGDADVSAETSNRPSSTPIRCHDAKRGEFWTNASNCGEADLDNRITYAQSLTPNQTAKERYHNARYLTPQQEAERSRVRRQAQHQPLPEKPVLLLNTKAPPSNLSANCKFPVGKTLELESVLSGADEPWKSKWRPDYCQWLGEVYDKKCEVADDLFYYKTLCRHR